MHVPILDVRMSITVPVGEEEGCEKVEIANVEGTSPPIQVEFVALLFFGLVRSNS